MLRIVRPTDRKTEEDSGVLRRIGSLITFILISEANGASAERRQRLQDLAILFHPEPRAYNL